MKGVQSRRAFWVSLAGLAIALPVAILVQSGTELSAVAEVRMTQPRVIEAPKGQPLSAGGVDWGPAAIETIDGVAPGTRIALVDLSATVKDAEQFAKAGPCGLTLSDPDGRIWEPAIDLSRSVIRAARPDLAARPPCGALTDNGPGVLPLMERFVVPEGATDLRLTITLLGEKPPLAILLR